MSKTSRLEQLEQECHGRGVKLIYDDLRGDGGLCRLRDGYFLILNRRLASETKARIIADALARVGDCPRMGTVPQADSVPSPEPAAQPSPAESVPVIEERPVPVYEEHLVGVPVAAGVTDNQS
jgi:Ni,Fe-hydrogenase I small subunit